TRRALLPRSTAIELSRAKREPPAESAASAVSGEARASRALIEVARASLFTSYLQRVEMKVGTALWHDDRLFDGAVVVFLRRRTYRRRRYVLPGVSLAPRPSFSPRAYLTG